MIIIIIIIIIISAGLCDGPGLCLSLAVVLGLSGCLRSQTEVKLLAAPQLCAPNMSGSAAQKRKKKGATEALCSALCHRRGSQGRLIDLLQSFHSLSNYMELLVYYRLSEEPSRIH